MEADVSECLTCHGVGQVVVASEVVFSWALPREVVERCEDCDGTGREPTEEEP